MEILEEPVVTSDRPPPSQVRRILFAILACVLALILASIYVGHSARYMLLLFGAGHGDSFSDCRKDCPQMVVVPPGEYRMRALRADYTKHPKRVTLPKAFAVGKFEITFDEWDACVADSGCAYRPATWGACLANTLCLWPRPADQDWARGDRPVMDVSWDDAQIYLAWLSKKTGHTYRLLSGAEYEYAQRGETTYQDHQPTYYWGDKPDHDMANAGRSPCCTGGKVQGKDHWMNTSPVGSFPPNRWGLYDMTGNLWSWIEDCYHDEATFDAMPATLLTDGRAWMSECTDGRKEMRGGSWNDDWNVLRTGQRNMHAADYRMYVVGFRVARDLTDDELKALARHNNLF